MEPKYTHIIFDLDGTLLNTLEDLGDAANHVCRENGWPEHTMDEYRYFVGNGIPKLVERFAPKEITPDQYDSALRDFKAYYQVHKEDKTAPYAGIPEMLEALQAAGFHMSVLTNKADEMAGPLMEGYFPGRLEAVQGALPDCPPKPDPTLLHRLMERLGAVPEHTLFVGDSNVDVRTGKNGGLDVCGVLWGFRTAEELTTEGADYLVQHPGELAYLLTGSAWLPEGELDTAVELLRSGETVGVPTETVYGLAADATQAHAVQAIYDAKGRPETKPLNVLVDGMAMVETVCADIPEDAYRLAEAFWPGPLTMILQGKGTLPEIVPAGGSTQGVRCPKHPATLELIRRLGKPLACPSANLSGAKSPKSAGDVIGQLAGRIPAVLDGGACTVGVESTILDLTHTPYRILRQGGLSKEAIQQALGKPVA